MVTPPVQCSKHLIVVCKSNDNHNFLEFLLIKSVRHKTIWPECDFKVCPVKGTHFVKFLNVSLQNAYMIQAFS